ncbi:argininosuccinate synthase [Candidatus Desulfovibrio trichonymphae]|uniref:Argininosuccinate synthase n=1 Tax=Candidatus Desulfovibrio trichonymphae TaxID=1725232 RepID=A0A1J1E3K8_9BACT|nr:argininosuccinate synthase [Candidatus Desulfovibrio trichonymphae]BAV92008.1 argininosuccinate synthase [Candidatus Desulfovibrio trichonymphae]
MKTVKKVVLAYSGGLDTSVILKWLIAERRCDVIAVTADLGQPEDLSGVEEKALRTGASKAFVLNLREEMARDFVFPMMRSGARYEGRYLLGTSIARPLIAKALVDVARAEGAHAVAHGATGKGNDQVRFEFAVSSLAPDLQVIAPWREWDLMSRTALTAFAAKHDIPISNKAKRYSMDANMLHTSFEGGELEDPGNEPHASCRQRCVPVEEAPETPEIVSVDFEHGNPVAVNGKQLSPASVISTLSKVAGRNGIGRDDMVENRFVGMKCRSVYENPAGTLLYKLHRDLEGICMDRELLAIRDTLAVRYSQCVYNGFWYSPEREAMQVFMDKSQEAVTGSVRAKLYKGGVWPLSRVSPNSLFSSELATFEEGGDYDHKDAEGFIRLNALRLRLHAAGTGRMATHSKKGRHE